MEGILPLCIRELRISRMARLSAKLRASNSLLDRVVLFIHTTEYTQAYTVSIYFFKRLFEDFFAVGFDEAPVGEDDFVEIPGKNPFHN